MAVEETSAEFKAKIMLDEANLAFSEITERKDSPGERIVDGSAWDTGKMDGEFDEEDYHKILELQMEQSIVCDEHPELEEKTEELFKKITPENVEEVLKEVLADRNIRELARISVVIFLLRFPTVQSFVNKGHPLVLATDEYMLENADGENWRSYDNIAREMGWL